MVFIPGIVIFSSSSVSFRHGEPLTSTSCRKKRLRRWGPDLCHMHKLMLVLKSTASSASSCVSPHAGETLMQTSQINHKNPSNHPKVGHFAWRLLVTVIS